MQKNMRVKLAIIIIAFVGIIFMLYTPRTTDRDDEPCLINPVPRGTIIILNGVSAVGKTSLQKALQEIMDEPYVAIGADSLLATTLPAWCMTGEAMGKTEKPKKGVEGMHGYYEQQGDNEVFKLEFGPACRNLIRGIHRTFAAMADEHNNIIIDYILYDQEWLPDLVDALHGYKVYFIGVKAPIDIIEKRERKRGTSPIGHARAYYDSVHKHKEYDIVVDTAQMSPEQAAYVIKEYVRNTPKPKSFKRLYKRLIG